MLVKNSVIFLFTALCFCLGCSAYIPINRDTVPEKRPEVDTASDRTALIRTADCDISIVQMTQKEWGKLASNRAFTKERIFDAPRILPYEMFRIVVTNSSDRNLYAVEFVSRYGSINKPAEKAADIVRRCSSPVYKNILFEKLFLPRRIISEGFVPENNDIDDDSLEYPFPFIMPLDSISFIAVFPQIPPDIRNYTITVSYTADKVKKNVDFRFMRLEHREKE